MNVTNHFLSVTSGGKSETKVSKNLSNFSADEELRVKGK